MKSKITLPAVFATVVAFALIFAVAPSAMADSEDGSKTYKRHWAISIGDQSGTLKITEDTDKEALKAQAISVDQAAAGYEDIVKARLGKAVNDSGEYYLIWKLVSVNHDTESDTKTFTVYVLDAGTGDLLTTMSKEGGKCGDKDKSETTLTSGEKA